MEKILITLPLSLITICLLLSSLGIAQQLPKGELEARWVNLPSSPLQFRTAPNGGSRIENHSTGRVVEYQLGCVIEEKGKLRIIKRLRAGLHSLEPMKDGAISPEGAFTFGVGLYPGYCQRGKTAVVKVWFEDGAVWKALQRSQLLLKP